MMEALSERLRTDGAGSEPRGRTGGRESALEGWMVPASVNKTDMLLHGTT